MDTRSLRYRLTTLVCRWSLGAARALFGTVLMALAEPSLRDHQRLCRIRSLELLVALPRPRDLSGNLESVRCLALGFN